MAIGDVLEPDLGACAQSTKLVQDYAVKSRAPGRESREPTREAAMAAFAKVRRPIAWSLARALQVRGAQALSSQENG
jgi:hypothetical protein